jgi:3-hydroxyacyl-[acyl-carrier-protein] dehydratase
MGALVDLIPHRAPWLLVDRVVARTEEMVEAEKRLAAGDPLLADGALPELLLVEALAQAAACLNAGALGRHRGLLVAATKFSFEGRACAGETVRLVARRTAALGTLVRFDGEASVDGRVVARGQMTFAVEEIAGP